MISFLQFMFNSPFFTLCFLFQLIPFWVPLLAIINGADPILMILMSTAGLLSRSYIQSQIMHRDTFSIFFRNFIGAPFKFVFKIVLLTAIILFSLYYGLTGENFDKVLAAVIIVYTVKLIYFRPSKNLYWNMEGLKIYRFYSFAGQLTIALLWLSVLAGGMDIYSNLAVGFTAIFLSGLTFYKVNEGLV